jgi:hypothetical protein
LQAQTNLTSLKSSRLQKIEAPGKKNHKPKSVAGTLVCNTYYVAGTTMDLQFTLNLTNTDEEYCDLFSLTFPAGITPNSSPNNPLITPAINPAATPTQLNPINGQTISWGTNDDYTRKSFFTFRFEWNRNDI